jgi:HAMP domain-containing protein
MRLSLKLFLSALVAAGLLAAYLVWSWTPRSLAQVEYDLLAVVLSVLLVLLSGIVVKLFMRRPLMMMAHALTRFAKGDLQAELPAERGGEIGALANGVSLMRDVIRRYETELRNEVS